MARLDATTRLGRRGIVAWRVDGVLARLTAKQSGKDDGLRNQIVQVVVAAGAEVAVKIRHRVMNNGDLADQFFPGYSMRKARGMAADYMRAAGAPVPHQVTYVPRNSHTAITVSTERYKTSREFHTAARVKDGTYDVTGGMWKGIQARGTGQTGVIIDFSGSSLGSGGEKEIKVKGRTRYTYTSQNVRNAWKARAIFDKHKVHVLKLTDEELQAMGLRVTRQVSRWLGLQLRQ